MGPAPSSYEWGEFGPSIGNSTDPKIGLPSKKMVENDGSGTT